ncbi:phage tail protein, partial [Vibrio vulnificus]|uniref:phage tail protein n=1 Tax=Vibrio vulnificus TaxID=672 RepID=UPI000D4B5962
NRTTFERSYEEGSKALVKSEDVLSWLNAPQLTRADLLDLMAKELGVLDWYYVDSEQAKRDSVEQAATIQRSAGTRAGLVKALKAIGVDAEIV